MSKICLIKKKKCITGNKVSKSNIKKKKIFSLNFKSIKIWNSCFFKKIKITTQSIKILKKCLF